MTAAADNQLLVEALGLTCVRVLLLLRARISGLPAGSTVTVVTDDPAAPLDLPAWCHLTGHGYLGPVASPLGPAYGIRVTADAKPADARRPWVMRA